MRSIQMGAIAAIVCATAATPALAIGALYSNQQDAIASCGAQVVWLNLDRQKYYVPGQPGYGAGHNGGYACRDQAEAEYFQARSAAAGPGETARSVAAASANNTTATDHRTP